MARSDECELLAIKPLRVEWIEIRRGFASSGEAQHADPPTMARHFYRHAISGPGICGENNHVDAGGWRAVSGNMNLMRTNSCRSVGPDRGVRYPDDGGSHGACDPDGGESNHSETD